MMQAQQQEGAAGRAGYRQDEAVRIALLVAPPLIWASLILLGDALMRDLPPLPLTFWSWAVAFLALLPFALGGLRRDWAAVRREGLAVAALGACGTTGFQYFWFAGLQTADAVNVAILTAALPTMVALGAGLLFREIAWPPVALASALTLAAGAMLALQGGGGSARFGAGEARILGADVLMTVYTLGCRARAWRCSPSVFMLLATAGGLVALAPPLLLGGHATQGLAAAARHPLAMLYLGVGAYLLAYLAWNRSVAVNGATRTAFALALQPVFGVVFAALGLGARVGPVHVAALGATLVAIVAVARAEDAHA